MIIEVLRKKKMLLSLVGAASSFVCFSTVNALDKSPIDHTEHVQEIRDMIMQHTSNGASVNITKSNTKCARCEQFHENIFIQVNKETANRVPCCVKLEHLIDLPLINITHMDDIDKY